MEKILDRSLYRQIKQMDKDTMQGFIQDIYESGKRDAEAHALDYDALRAELAQIKGIGEARLNEIMTVLEHHLAPSNENKS